MPRPSGQSDRRLLQAARELIEQRGFSGLTVRKVAARAGVNLGLFHYHFGNIRRFKRRVLQEFYEDFFKEFTLEAGGGTPEERLRRALFFLGRFSRERRRLLLVLVRDALDGDPDTVAFLNANVVRHIAIIMQIIAQCQARGSLPDAPLPTLMPLLMGGIGMPSLIFGALEQAGARRPFGFLLSRLASVMVSDRAIQKRIDLLWSGLGRTGTR